VDRYTLPIPIDSLLSDAAKDPVFTMRDNFRYLLVVLMLSFSCGVVRTADGQVRCSAEVSYKWVKAPESKPSPPPAEHVTAPEKGKKAPAEAPTPVPAPPTPEPVVVKMMGIERSGADENAAKGALQVETDKQRIRASELCKRDHESFGSCLASKLSNRASVLNSLSFKTRQELETALSEECKRQQGTCLATEVSEPKCVQMAAAGSEQGSGAAGDKKADAGKKGDPKKK